MSPLRRIGLPSLEIDLTRLRENIAFELSLLKPFGVSVMGVNKVFNGLQATAQCLIEGGVSVIAESRLENLKKYKNLTCTKVLLRSPLLSEVEDVVKFSDVALVTEIQIVEALNHVSHRFGKRYQVMPMIDMGDLREGIWFENYDDICELLLKIKQSPNLDFYGIGTNFNCFGAIRPSLQKLQDFKRLVDRLQIDCAVSFPVVSGGNCTSYHLIHQGQWVEGVNELRIGGLHQFGIEYVENQFVEGFHHSKFPVSQVCSDLYLLRAEIIEVNAKPTVPSGEAGVDAFLKKKTFVDLGVRRRAILALGKQDLPSENIWPRDSALKIIGQTSDHTLIDIQESSREYKVGDVLEFELDYTALLHACQSPSIRKTFCGVELE